MTMIDAVLLNGRSTCCSVGPWPWRGDGCRDVTLSRFQWRAGERIATF